MKSLIILFHLCFALILNGKELTAEESTAVKKEVLSLMNKFNQGDPSDCLLKTHPSLIKMMGGQEAFETIMAKAVQAITKMGVKFEKIELGEPTQLYIAGDEEVCFVPQESIIRVKDKRLKSISYMVAIRSVKTKEWKFLDGAGMKDKKEILWQLLPKLRKDIALPKNTMEILPNKKPAEPAKPAKPLLLEVLVAKPVPGKPGFFFNPHTNKIIDCTGIPSGTKIRDPNDPNSAHTFRIP